jgi:hypothetical protein
MLAFAPPPGRTVQRFLPLAATSHRIGAPLKTAATDAAQEGLTRGVSKGSRTVFALLLCASLLATTGASAWPVRRTPPPSRIKRLVVWVLNLFELPKP